MCPTHIVLAYSGSPDRPDELDTLDTAEEISDIIKKMPGYRLTQFSCTGELVSILPKLTALQPDCVFNLVESLQGSDAEVYRFTQLLDFLRIPYTGSPSQALSWTADKPLMKAYLGSAGIATPECLDKQACEKIDGTVPYIVKSATEHGSLGIDENAIQHEAAALCDVIRCNEKKYGGSWFAERFIAGRECYVTLLEIEGVVTALPVYELLFFHSVPQTYNVLTYQQKWNEEEAKTKTTRQFMKEDVHGDLMQALVKQALACWQSLGLHAYARVDFRVDEEQNPWVIDVNANPCLASDAGFMAAAQAHGLTPEAVIKHILLAGEP